MRAARLVLLALAFASSGCAMVFRDSKPTVHFESAPTGAHVEVKGAEVGTTPNDAKVDRGGLTVVTYRKDGYEDHVGIVKKNVNAGWLVLDILLCPITICIPLIADGVSGAWKDVSPVYSAGLDPLPQRGPVAGRPPAVVTTTPPVVTTQPTTTAPPPSMSESERKATARAAYMEGAALQEKGDCAAALPRFETAQKLFDAPTHVLRIAQCQAQTGKLVEAQESYETLVHAKLATDAPDAFKQAQEAAKKELPAVKPRVPTVRLVVTTASGAKPEGLAVQLNGRQMPAELVGIARPLNPGTYKIVVTARGLRGQPVDLELREGEQRTIEVPLH
jgi:hypothetical protein